MIPPTSIDGTDITGATIDGTEVTEITVDGDTVFSAQTLPVAYSNLVAWYPFDSATYGGANPNDVTAILGGSGDDTAYGGTVNGATYQSSGGVTDIEAGANSGGFDFDGSNDFIEVPITVSVLTTPVTMSFWFNADAFPGSQARMLSNRSSDFSKEHFAFRESGGNIQFFYDNGPDFILLTGPTITTGVWNFVAITYDGSTLKLYYNAGSSAVDTTSSSPGMFSSNNTRIGDSIEQAGLFAFDGTIDDVRFYNAALSGTQINQIYENTEP